MPGFSPSIELECPEEFSTYWSAFSELNGFFENNRLKIRLVKPEDYAPIEEGEGQKAVTGYRNNFATLRYKKIGFRMRVRNTVDTLRIALEELANANLVPGQPCSIEPIKIRDYIYLKDRLDLDRGYRLREGLFIGGIENLQGTIVEGYINCQGKEVIQGIRRNNGFAFKFMELDTIYTY
jgi:hypothetical protein